MEPTLITTIVLGILVFIDTIIILRNKEIIWNQEKLAFMLKKGYGRVHLYTKNKRRLEKIVKFRGQTGVKIDGKTYMFSVENINTDLYNVPEVSVFEGHTTSPINTYMTKTELVQIPCDEKENHIHKFEIPTEIKRDELTADLIDGLLMKAEDLGRRSAMDKILKEEQIDLLAKYASLLAGAGAILTFLTMQGVNKLLVHFGI